MVTLGELLEPANETAVLEPADDYHEVTVRLWGKGVVSRGLVRGLEVTAPRRFVRAGQFILSKIDARHGACGIVPAELDGAIVSSDFPTFQQQEHADLDMAYLGWLARSAWFIELCKKASKGSTNRVRINETRFLNQEIPLPSLDEQQAIANRLDALTDKSRQLTAHLDAIDADADRLLAQRFERIIAGAPYKPMAEVAPDERRHVTLDPAQRYPELGARSFGRGLFKKPDFDAASATWQKPVWIKSGDIVFSNIKAWEGAIALATGEFDGYIASHRYITCVADQTQLLPQFLLHYLQSTEGMERVNTASPGTADRNRTLRLSNLREIAVPVPPLPIQRDFVALRAKIMALKAQHEDQRRVSTAVTPSTLARLFAGATGT